MDPAERVGYLGTFVVFLVCGILLIVFGVRRLMKRAAIKRQLQYGPAAYQPQPYSQQPYDPPSYNPQSYNPQGGYQPPGYTTNPPNPYGAPPNPYGAQPIEPGPTPAKQQPPNLALSILMIVLGALLALSVLSAVAQSGSGAA